MEDDSTGSSASRPRAGTAVAHDAACGLRMLDSPHHLSHRHRFTANPANTAVANRAAITEAGGLCQSC